MHAFIVKLDNRPGSLADLTEALGERGINITSAAGMAWDGGSGGVMLITNDDDATKSLLEDRADDFRQLELVAASMDDRPGTLGEAARRLAKRGVNVELLLPTGMDGSKVSVAFGVDDVPAAREALGELAAAGGRAV